MASLNTIDGRYGFVIIGPAGHPAPRASARVLPFFDGRKSPVQKPAARSADNIAARDAASARWQRLMVAAQSGDQRDYATLLQEAAKFVRIIARRYHADPATVEDVVQETLLSMHRIRHTYEPGRPVEPWVAAIAKARAIDALRARKRRAAFVREAASDTLDGVADGTPSDEANLAMRGEIAVALEGLPPGQRAAVQMLKIEEMSLREAAQASGQSIPALKSLLHRAMLSLRAALRGGGDA